ncbi:GtrA family protein [Mangrovihabitans endophyticus]|uniref:GtrA/DPMS transmembrane domain-containing protein n=1 Tax=Mangrovihabitans endophyticus TaxID=1751298 RepID=A0A8J3C2C4_9ACTN|nr:GtrA family protein [Mangrovihabitans endophyticus]GGL08544.1 hypothetical protein GCM10012284_48890 [Mangrovihabitans endophyticus]
MPAPTSTPPSHGLRAKLGGLIREVSKFGTVGGLAFAIDFLVFNALLKLGAETLVAKTTSTVIATTIAFVGNRFWTWRHRAHHHMGRQYTMFFLLNAIGLGIALACLAISHYGLGHFWPVLQSQLADNISGQLIGSAFGTLFRFWSYRRFVFRDAEVAEAAMPELAEPLESPSNTPPAERQPSSAPRS